MIAINSQKYYKTYSVEPLVVAPAAGRGLAAREAFRIDNKSCALLIVIVYDISMQKVGNILGKSDPHF